MEPDGKPEESLDPGDWEPTFELGHRILEDMLSLLQTLRERPVWTPTTEEVRSYFEEPVPRLSSDVKNAYRDFQEQVQPYPLGNIHPRFWGWVNGSGTAAGFLAQIMAAALNPNCSGFDQAATYVERQVLAWFAELMGFPEDAGGLLVSGGSMANFVGLAVARSAKAPNSVRKTGQTGQPAMRLYASTQTHNSVQKAVELLGLGNEALRKIPVRADFTINISALKEAIAEDKAAGFLPFCVVGNAGTVNTGAFDDLSALADLCQAENCWLHVDGAFGALAALSPRLNPITRGMARADSLAFDLHKWLHMPYDSGCVLVRDAKTQADSFRIEADYLSPIQGGVAQVPTVFSDMGLQLSRSFRALPVWFALKTYGIDRLARLIVQNTEQATYLANRVDEEPELERLAPCLLNIVNYRYRIPGLGSEALNKLNKRILVALQRSGVAVPSHTYIDGSFSIRVSICNHRTRREDLDLLVHETLTHGRKLARGVETEHAEPCHA